VHVVVHALKLIHRVSKNKNWWVYAQLLKFPNKGE
jgi:hypothetical protein